MQLAKLRLADGSTATAVVEGAGFRLLPPDDVYNSLAAILDSPDPKTTVTALLTASPGVVSADSVTLLAPIDQQEVWAAGVTYRRSQVARMEESQGAAVFYDQVYLADRPELFFKATPHRVSGPGEPVRIRSDAGWNVPEPELALVLNARLELVGYSIGNDMSSRDIEGANPLYLPQAKVYDACCGLGPWITLASSMPGPEQIDIELAIERHGEVAFRGTTSISQMARTFAELVGWLGRDNSFPAGAFLLTGTGIVPSDAFTLAAGDMVRITISGIGTLANPVVQAS
jgi:2-dehydro-3-deoxy-D-arabinonate dehydratase